MDLLAIRVKCLFKSQFNFTKYQNVQHVQTKNINLVSNPLPDHKILDKSKLKAFPGDKMKVVKPVLETTCIKSPPALRDHCSDTTTLLKSAK